MTDLYRRFDGYDELGPLLDVSEEQALHALGGTPALIRIPGTQPARARLTACLLHGNEDSGYRAVHALLRERVRFPFDWWVLVGNVRAATEEGPFAHRHLDDQEDFNRVWGLDEPTTRMRRCAQAILTELCAHPLEASLDLHNNTGRNPYYAILPEPSAPDGLGLAALCAPRVLRWRLPAHTLMEAMAARCASVAVECGVPGVPENTAFAAGVLRGFLAADAFEGVPERLLDMRVRVTVRPEVPFAVGERSTGVEFLLRPGLDAYNFGVLSGGTAIGWTDPKAAMPLCATDMAGTDVTDAYFSVSGEGAVTVARDMRPVMMTTQAVQIRRDCLFYAAECSTPPSAARAAW